MGAEICDDDEITMVMETSIVQMLIVLVILAAIRFKSTCRLFKSVIVPTALTTMRTM